jgi:glycosyltransferase involved in cell wall biosynthesis
LSSRFEGFGNVLVEALAHGLPVVSFDCDSGPRDIIRNGIDGFLVEPNNITKLSESLSILMNDSSLRDNFSYNAYQARSRFSINKISDQWISLFGEINQNYDK